MAKTHYTKPSEVEARWVVIDANNKVLGRLASEVAQLLRGKHKPIFSTSVDTGDHVIIINADKIAMTGNKEATKIYRTYSGYPGGLREISFQLMRVKHPERIVETAVWGMMPKNILGRKQIRKLHVYAGPEHQHEAQKPVAIEV